MAKGGEYMNKTIKKLGAGVITTGLFALSAVPSAFASEITIGGNGAGSDNSIDLRSQNDTNVTQRNNSTISNTVETSQNTGGNRANFNTGGDVTIVTGDAESDVSIVNKTGSNYAYLNNFGRNHEFDLAIVGNGAFSDNEINVRHNNSLDVDQSNRSRIDNDVTVRQNTGHNRVSGNTDERCDFNHHNNFFWRFFERENCDKHGDVLISTGDASSTVRIHNTTGSNFFLRD